VLVWQTNCQLRDVDPYLMTTCVGVEGRPSDTRTHLANVLQIAGAGKEEVSKLVKADRQHPVLHSTAQSAAAPASSCTPHVHMAAEIPCSLSRASPAGRGQ